MPLKSSKQQRFMYGVLGGSIRGGSAPSKAVAKEFVDKTPASKRRRFAANLKNKKKERK